MALKECILSPMSHVPRLTTQKGGVSANGKKSICNSKITGPGRQSDAGPAGGSRVGSARVNIMAFVKEYNERTAAQAGLIIPVEITVYEDRSFTFVTKTPPAAVLLKKAAGLEKASGEPNIKKVAKLPRSKVREIAELKMPDLNAASVEAAMLMVEGTARSMGIEIVEG